MFLKKILLGILLLSGLQLSAAALASQSEMSFEQYLDGLRQQALKEGISQAFVDKSFANIKLFKKALVSDKQSAPQSLDHYLSSLVSEPLVEQSRALYKANKVEFERLGKQYQVQPRFVIALWGMTSSLGLDVGDYPVLTVIASNAYRGDNEEFYRKEFIAGLKLLQSSDIEFSGLKSNWSGKMGYPHFSPSDYATYAKDGNGDGNIDIWNNLADAFASTANYLKQLGWNDEGTWGRQVQVPKDISQDLVGLATQKPFLQWQELGVRRFDGSDLPKVKGMQVSLIMPDGITGRKYLVYDNYRALLKWNSSDYYGLSLTYLSERIKYPAID
ncbi:lytic murein transglycosylase [Shewanella mesophila]|uniref:lytic murein transglycosylase n=1 Tax=Shewanella mesophila TaxID=2864208 RepID=UPI001C66067B|nr:lytic murein transglycosylase [Shewanella mesophila]QYJ84688.1 lytic murein transglycosylase [Shewanella mesophila]